MGCEQTPSLVVTEVHCFEIQTKKTGSGCKMKVKAREADGSDDADGYGEWKDAGTICFEFTLHETSEGECYVKVAPA